MTEFFSVILNDGLTSVFRDLKIRSSAVRKAGCQSVISEQSSPKIYSLSWERVSEGQERVNTMLPTLSPSLIRDGSNLVSLFTFHTSLKSKLAFTLVEGATHVALLNNQRKFLINNSPDSADPSVYVSIDENGYNKRPSRLGQDLFMFQLDDEGKLLPMGAKGTAFYDENDAYCSKSSNNSLNGAGCTYKALSDPTFWKTLP